MLRPFQDEVEALLRDALSDRGHPTDDLGIETPPEDVDAILASSVAFRLAEAEGAPPPAVAADLAAAVDPADATYVDAVEQLGPYLNFTPGPAYYRDTVDAARDESYGRLAPTGQRVVVEHTSANPTGPVHVGRARNPIIGDAIARLLAAAGHDVARHYYVNDAGRQVAMLTWAVETFDESALPAPERDRADYDLVRYYRHGNEFLESAAEAEREAAEAEIAEIMAGLERGDESTHDRVSQVVDRMLEGMRESLHRLPVEFDEFIKETRFIRDGRVDDLVDRLQDLPEAVYEEEAWQLDLTAVGIEKNLVFLRADGTSLYTTRDIAHHEWKLDRYDRAVTVLGEDHKLQAEQLTATLSLLDRDVDRLRTVFYSWVNLPEGGMSTRAGTGIDLDELLDEAVDRARAEVEDRLDDRIRDDELTEPDIDRIARQVGIGAVRFDIVAKQPTKGITFEWDRALDFEAQSAPYVQYVHARCCGILAAAEAVPEEVDPTVLEHPAERALIEEIARFPAEVEGAAAGCEPHRIATYTRDIAEAFNGFYRECPVLTADSPERRDARLTLVRGAKHTVANALDILGVSAPESM